MREMWEVLKMFLVLGAFFLVVLAVTSVFTWALFGKFPWETSGGAPSPYLIPFFFG